MDVQHRGDFFDRTTTRRLLYNYLLEFILFKYSWLTSVFSFYYLAAIRRLRLLLAVK